MQFTPAGGEVAFRIFPTAASDVPAAGVDLAPAASGSPRLATTSGGIDARTPDGVVWVTLRVEDTGSGVPADKLPHMFKPFGQ